jgi:tetratricopeptide (TPR) repeat protein
MLFTWDWVGAKNDIERALALAPGDSYARARYGDLLASLGRLGDAISETSRAAEIDPLSPFAWWRLGGYYNATGQYDLARRAVDRALEAAPGYVYAIRKRAFIDVLAGDPATALAVSEGNPTEYMRLTGVALARHDLGHRGEFQRAFDALRSKAGNAYQVAQVYAWTGDRDHAFEALEQAYALRSAAIHYVTYDPFLRSLRRDPRYAAFLRKVNLPVR